MTTARDVIADFLYLHGRECYLEDARKTAEDILAALLSAPDPVRLELAGMLNPWRPIEGAPKDRPILAWMWEGWRIAKWNADSLHHPYWDVAGWRMKSCRKHQPKWWTELPAPPSEDKPK